MSSEQCVEESVLQSTLPILCLSSVDEYLSFDRMPSNIIRLRAAARERIYPHTHKDARTHTHTHSRTHTHPHPRAVAFRNALRIVRKVRSYTFVYSEGVAHSAAA